MALINEALLSRGDAALRLEQGLELGDEDVRLASDRELLPSRSRLDDNFNRHLMK